MHSARKGYGRCILHLSTLINSGSVRDFLSDEVTPCCAYIRDPLKAHTTGCSATSRTGFDEAWQLPNLFEVNTNPGGEGGVPAAEKENVLLTVISCVFSGAKSEWGI